MGRIVCIDLDPNRRARAIDWGADDALDSLDPAWAHAPQTSARGWVDYVFDTLPHVSPTESGSDTRGQAMRSLCPGGQYTIYGATNVPQQVDTWAILAKGLTVRAAPFDVDLFPLTRSAVLLKKAVEMIRDKVVDAADLVTDEVNFHDGDAVADAFAKYGLAGRLKTSIVL